MVPVPGSLISVKKEWKVGGREVVESGAGVTVEVEGSVRLGAACCCCCWESAVFWRRGEGRGEGCCWAGVSPVERECEVCGVWEGGISELVRWGG